MIGNKATVWILGWFGLILAAVLWMQSTKEQDELPSPSPSVSVSAGHSPRGGDK